MQKYINNKGILIGLIFILGACTNNVKHLPYMGEPLVTKHFINGQEVYDSAYPVLPSFQLTDQDGQSVTRESMSGKVYVADFIFLSCPSICPRMTANMQLVYNYFPGNEHINFLSHTIDPDHDTLPRLRAYKKSLDISDDRWKFVTGNIDSIYTLAEKHYYATVYKDSTAPGGFIHSGGLLLVDQRGHIRGVYDGTDKQEAYKLINDIQILLKEPASDK